MESKFFGYEPYLVKVTRLVGSNDWRNSFEWHRDYEVDVNLAREEGSWEERLVNGWESYNPTEPNKVYSYVFTFILPNYYKVLVKRYNNIWKVEVIKYYEKPISVEFCKNETEVFEVLEKTMANEPRFKEHYFGCKEYFKGMSLNQFGTECVYSFNIKGNDVWVTYHDCDYVEIPFPWEISVKASNTIAVETVEKVEEYFRLIKI